jgi:hypothetical protein
VTGGPVSIAVGARLTLDGAEWTVEGCWPPSGRVVLRGADGTRRPATIRALVNDLGFGPVTADGDPGGGLAGLEDLDDTERERLHLRVAHLLEAETGFRSGTPLRALDGEPPPEYDPGCHHAGPAASREGSGTADTGAGAAETAHRGGGG